MFSPGCPTVPDIVFSLCSLLSFRCIRMLALFFFLAALFRFLQKHFLKNHLFPPFSQFYSSNYTQFPFLLLLIVFIFYFYYLLILLNLFVLVIHLFLVISSLQQVSLTLCKDLRIILSLLYGLFSAYYELHFTSRLCFLSTTPSFLPYFLFGLQDPLFFSFRLSYFVLISHNVGRYYKFCLCQLIFSTFLFFLFPRFSPVLYSFQLVCEFIFL
jgi:hypothetical protein